MRFALDAVELAADSAGNPLGSPRLVLLGLVVLIVALVIVLLVRRR